MLSVNRESVYELTEIFLIGTGIPGILLIKSSISFSWCCSYASCVFDGSEILIAFGYAMSPEALLCSLVMQHVLLDFFQVDYQSECALHHLFNRWWLLLSEFQVKASILPQCGILSCWASVRWHTLQSSANIVSFAHIFHCSLAPIDGFVRSFGSTDFPFENCDLGSL